MEPKIIDVTVSWTGENFNGGFGTDEIGAVVVAADTLDEFKKEFEESLSFHIEGLVENGEPVPEYLLSNNYTIKYNLETSALLKEAENFTTLAAISRATGINQKQLSHYVSGLKQPRASSRARIVQGLHSIGRRALSLF